MPLLLASLLVHSGRLAAGLIGGAVLLWMMGGSGETGTSAAVDSTARHGAARSAMAHLDDMRTIVARLATDRVAALDADLKQARAALGTDMIALRELVGTEAEELELRGTLAALALYQAAWIDARDKARSGDPDGARRSLAAAAPLGDRAAAALASLGHRLDAGNADAARMRSAAERTHRLRNAAMAFFAAGALLLWTGRRRTGTAVAAGRIG